MTHYEDKEVEFIYQAYNPDNLRKHLLRQTLKDHDELMKIDTTHKLDQDDDAIAGRS